ncbi:MAG: Double zinc ribbon [Acidobacteria bacterium]|nr:Double zinc ribbon [Acidobacteriota bacterium]
MIVRCGRCGVQVEVPGPGRYSCPGCGTLMEVRSREADPGLVSPPPPAPAPPPSPRVVCPECGFRFIVGAVATAPCPNCGAAVAVPDGEGK